MGVELVHQTHRPACPEAVAIPPSLSPGKNANLKIEFSHIDPVERGLGRQLLTGNLVILGVNV